MSKAEKQQGRFKFKFNKHMLIAYHVPCTVLGLLENTMMNEFDSCLGEITAYQGR